MHAIVPEPDDTVRAEDIFYDLSVMSLKSSLKTGWKTFVESGTADAWHCVSLVLSSRDGAVSDGGRCPRHGTRGCLRVMLRREGGLARTLFTMPRGE